MRRCYALLSADTPALYTPPLAASGATSLMSPLILLPCRQNTKAQVVDVAAFFFTPLRYTCAASLPRPRLIPSLPMPACRDYADAAAVSYAYADMIRLRLPC